MEFVGQAVPYRNAGILGQGFNHFLAVAAILNTVVHAPQHAGGVFNRLFMANLAAAGAEPGDASALVKCGNFERASGAGRVFFEDERDVFAGEMLNFNIVFLISFKPGRQLKQSGDFGGGKIEQL